MESLFGTEFNDVKAARAAIDAIGKKVGFSLVIQVTKPNCVKLRCSKGKRFKSQANAELATSRHRKTSSQMTGCPYKLLITQRPDGVWQIRDSDNDSANKHNHEMLPQAAFSRYRTSTVEKLKGDIISMYNAGIRPRLVLNKIRSGGHLDVQALTRHDIYNVIQKHREAELGGRSEMQWLFDKLQDDENYYCRHRRDEENRLTALFICPKDSINLLRQYSSVLLMDCTYKTNRFNLPLFNICGITSTKKTFQVAAVFMTGEDQAQFEWAIGTFDAMLREFEIPMPHVIVTDRELALMNALEVYSSTNAAAHILCRWHVNMNVLAKTKRFFPKARYNPATKRTERAPQFQSFLKAWNGLIASPSEAEYDTRFRALTTAQPGQPAYPKDAIDYICNTWLFPWKQKIVRCWVDQKRHFGHTTTSVVESLHSVMKKYIVSSCGDLSTVFRRLEGFWQNQQQDIRNLQAQRMNKIPNSSRQLLYVVVRERVSPEALLLIQREHQTLERSGEQDHTGACGPCVFKTIYGLPCRHDLARRVRERQPIQLEEIHPFWRWEKAYPASDRPVPSAPLEPLAIKGKGRPKGSLNVEKDRTTTREPSLFERVIALEDNEARDNRQHLQQQPPPSTAPAVMASANNSVTMPSTTAVGIRFLATFDTYEPGTEMQRSYQRSIQRLEEYDSEETPRETSQLPIRERQQLHFEERESQWSDTDAPGEWDDEINPEFEDAMDNAWAKAEQDAIAIQEDVAANSNTKE